MIKTTEEMAKIVKRQFKEEEEEEEREKGVDGKEEGGRAGEGGAK